MGYKVLKQGWRLIAILAIGFSSGCSGNEKIKGIDLDEVGYGSSVFSVLKGEDYESEALKLPEGVGEDITVKIKDVRNFSTKESEPLFFESCEVIGWSSPVDLNTDKTMEAVLAKYNPVQKATLSVDASTGKLILYGAGTKNIPAAVYLVDLEISSGGVTQVKEGVCRIQLKDNSAKAVTVSATWGTTDSDKAPADVSSKELSEEELQEFAGALGSAYNKNYGYLILKVKDRRNQSISWKDRWVPRTNKNNFETANPWAEIIYTDEAVIVPYPVPSYPVVSQSTGNAVQYKVEKANTAFRKDLFFDCNLSVTQKGVFEIECRLTDSEVQGKATVLPSGKKLFFPVQDDLRSMDFYDDNSRLSYHRMVSSENFVVFWEKGFGDDPKSAPPLNGVDMTVDLDDLLEKGERFYKLYHDSLNFVTPGNSNVDSIRMMVIVHYTTTWTAYGGGYDDVIGALWVNPATMKPVGQTIAHEFGHSFQYQVYCDDPNKEAGFRQGQSGTSQDGNSFWEMCAQHMAWQNIALFPEWNCDVPIYLANHHRGFMHEWLRYQAFYLMEYWRMKHGEDMLGRVWRESKSHEDPITAYKRIAGLSQDQFNAEVWESACHDITWDYPLGGYLRRIVDRQSEADRQTWYTHKTRLIAENGYYRSYPDTVTADHGTEQNIAFTPHDYGYNAFQLSVPEGGTTVTAEFEGITGDSRYRTVGDSKAGWRFGFVGVQGSWTPVYGDMGVATGTAPQASVSFTVPGGGLKRLWFVVSGAPTRHEPHVWDDDVSNDEEYPYRVKFVNTEVKN